MAYRSIGELERLLLFALLRLEEAAYGVTVQREVAERTGRELAPGAIYTTMARLERRGFVESFLGDRTRQRGGKRKRYYRLLPAGREALEASQDVMRQIQEALADGRSR